MLLTILRLWNGNERLVVAFWYLFLPLQIIHYIFIVNTPLLIQMLFFLLIVFSYIAVWRCAPNYKKGLIAWVFIVRAFIILRIIFTIFLII